MNNHYAALVTICHPRFGWVSSDLHVSCSTVPLNVGLHRDLAFCPVSGLCEVHTQIVGFGKMQQFCEDVSPLYLVESIVPGTTRRPVQDADGNYPWHQFETIPPSIFMVVEMLPEGATLPFL